MMGRQIKTLQSLCAAIVVPAQIGTAEALRATGQTVRIVVPFPRGGTEIPTGRVARVVKGAGIKAD